MNPATAVAAAATLPTPPRRRSTKHKDLGQYLGGCRLNNDYRFINLRGSYKFTEQVRHNNKSNILLEQSLTKDRDSLTTVNFDEKMTATARSITDLGKEDFVKKFAQRVNVHGQQTFYYIQDPITQDIVNLFMNLHRFTLDIVVAEYERRIDSNNAEFEAYDTLEIMDITMSRLVVESLLSPAILYRIQVTFGHGDDFFELPGSCLFMMTLEVCHASLSQDITGATKTLGNLPLSLYPRENVADFAVEDQRLINAMQGGYALPVAICSKLLLKVTKTMYDYFNYKISNLLDKKLMKNK